MRPTRFTRPARPGCAGIPSAGGCSSSWPLPAPPGWGPRVLFFASARFRLPLAAICAVLAGGALGSPGFWGRFSAGHRAGLAAWIALAGFAAFSSLGGVADPSTFVQDHVLLARAALTVGDDATALAEARAALALQPWHPDAAAIAAAASAEIVGKAAPK
jgi:hypothetical protein